MRAFIILFLLLAAGCKDVPMLPSVTPYKIDIQQGNLVTQDMVDKLQPGMSRTQVRFILGTPLVVDAFRNDRWDYVYLFRKGGGETEQRRLVVYFKDDKLLRVDGDPMPPGPAPRSAASLTKPAPGAAAGTAPASGEKPPAATAESAKDETKAEAESRKPQGEEKGFFRRMLEKLGF
jgi:outer membrane protein assembly factor BamE